MVLNKYYFKNFDGFIYVEDYEDHEEKERCKIYDENNNYLDYISVMEFDGVWDEFSENDYNDYKKYIEYLLNADDEISFFENFCDSFDFDIDPSELMINGYMTDIELGHDYEDIKDEIEQIKHDINTMTEKEFINVYDINKIGKYYFRGNW